MTCPTLASFFDEETRLAEAAEILDLPVTSLAERVCNNWSNVAEDWNQIYDDSTDSIRHFYASSLSNILDQLHWYLFSPDRLWKRRVIRLAAVLGLGKHSLDFGAGIGDVVLLNHILGGDMIYCDIEGVLTDFAKARAQRYGLDVCFLSSSQLVSLPRGLQFVNCQDVFEHLPDPIGTLRALHSSLDIGGLLLFSHQFHHSEGQPFHLKQNEIMQELFPQELQELNFTEITTEPISIFMKVAPC